MFIYKNKSFSRIFSRVLFVATASAMISACTSQLTVKKLKPSNQPVQGVVYYLPKSQFKIDASYVLQKCRDTYIKEGFKATKSAVITHKNKVDLDKAFVIDYQTLQAASKEYELEIKLYKNGLLQSINTTAKDKTGEVILAVASAASKLALLNVAGAPGILAIPAVETQSALGVKVPSNICNKKTIDSLDKLDAANDAQEKALKEADEKKEAIIKLRGVIIAAGGDLVNDTILKQELTQLKTLYAIYQVEKKKHVDYKKQLTIAQSFSLIGAKSDSLPFNKSLLSKWLMDEKKLAEKMKLLNQGVDEEKIKKEARDYLDKSTTSLQGTLNLFFKIDGLNPKSVFTDNASSKDGVVYKIKDGIVYKIDSIHTGSYNGIVYQQSAETSVMVCNDSNCDTGGVLKSESLMLPDAGQLAVLPFENTAFQENALEAEFSEEGSLTRVKLSSNAVLNEQAELLQSLADIKFEYETTKAKAKSAEQEALKAENQAVIDYSRTEELADLNHKIALLENEAKLAKLSAEPDVDEELKALERAMKLKRLTNEFATLAMQDAENALKQLTSEQEIEKLLK